MSNAVAFFDQALAVCAVTSTKRLTVHHGKHNPDVRVWKLTPEYKDAQVCFRILPAPDGEAPVSFYTVHTYYRANGRGGPWTFIEPCLPDCILCDHFHGSPPGDRAVRLAMNALVGVNPLHPEQCGSVVVLDVPERVILDIRAQLHRDEDSVWGEQGHVLKLSAAWTGKTRTIPHYKVGWQAHPTPLSSIPDCFMAARHSLIDYPRRDRDDVERSFLNLNLKAVNSSKSVN